MAVKDFKQAVGRIIFETGVDDHGKPIRKTKTYRNLAAQAEASSIYEALEALSGLSAFPVVEVEHIVTETIRQ